MWEKKEVKKAELSVLDISSAIIARVEEIPEQMDYFYLGKLCYIKTAFTAELGVIRIKFYLDD